ncbi:permease-like cell division protein FtsX [Amycolatopsis rhabdoformis]|uniref:Permease-like cell division protein FtsX n=1 Tax=Amycolatopsis rhabdoformis TaxID=1448059 RepID=A0ABZ1IBI8_9PSEU|nr:permease-like cell division protein FtsX [Amycolatopsis rhabdoformis]WSE30998.1 permease-like cell division protein FtsX [Amycolatopsis rhabdoformis]
MGMRRWRWLAPVLVLALGVGAGLALLVGAAVRSEAVAVDRTPVPLAGHRPCAAVQVTFDDDRLMRRDAEALAGDEQARRVYTETKAEAWVQFQDLFKDDPRLVSQLGPDNMPATLTVIPVPGTDLKAYAAELGKRFPSAQSSEPFDVESVRRQVAPDSGSPLCPPAGEL